MNLNAITSGLTLVVASALVDSIRGRPSRPTSILSLLGYVLILAQFLQMP